MFDRKIPYNDLPLLPWKFDFDKKEFLKLAIKASEEISKLNGLSYLIPNLEILISPLLIKESVESSAIENINTTTLKVLQSKALAIESVKWPEKEVLHYHNAIMTGFEKLKKEGGIWYNFLVELQSYIEPDKIWIRKIPWTVIANGYGEVVYTPPVGYETIVKLLTNLEKFINNFDDDIDALIKMPVIHYQFESIHPFYDGNGRTGRILNVLYLVLAKKLDFPILFLSEYINHSKQKYYDLLNKTSQTWDYGEFIVYLLQWIISQAKNTSKKIITIKNLIQKTEIKLSHLKMDNYKMIHILFSKPFMTVSDFTKEIWLSRQSATKYIHILEQEKIISSIKIWKNKLIYIPDFINLLT